MKVVYSLKEFRDMVKEIAIKAGRKFYAVEVKITSYDTETNKGEMQFQCYIDGYSHAKGFSMEDSIRKMKEQCFGAKEPPNDVEIDDEMPLTEEQEKDKEEQRWNKTIEEVRAVANNHANDISMIN